jgi:HD-like signal output (HDOD) protein
MGRAANEVRLAASRPFGYKPNGRGEVGVMVLEFKRGRERELNRRPGHRERGAGMPIPVVARPNAALSYLLDAAIAALREGDLETFRRTTQVAAGLDPHNGELLALLEQARGVGAVAPESPSPRRQMPPARAGRAFYQPEGTSLTQLVRRIDSLQPLPAVAFRVLEAARDEGSCSAMQLARLISADQALTAKVIHVANSGPYAGRPRATTVRDAIVRLGVHTVRSLAMTATAMESMSGRSNNLDQGQFWRFSFLVGFLAELGSQFARRSREGEAFAAGVLHDVGLLALDQHAPSELRNSIVYSEANGTSLEDGEVMVLGFTHAELGAALLEQWNFSPAIVEASRLHLAEPWDLTGAGSLARHVVDARAYALAAGYGPGLGTDDDGMDEDEQAAILLDSPLAGALNALGGLHLVTERIDSLLDY